MGIPMRNEAILDALEEYASDHDGTFIPALFVGWVREHHHTLFLEVGEEALFRFASELISGAGNDIAYAHR